jgi:tripartite-type tricarboxylate transporter receptor subunit TctC
MSQELARQLGQSIVIENRGGANTIIGTRTVAQAAPDGYTIGLANPSLITNPALTRALPYRTPEDFTPIAHFITYPFVLAVRQELPARSVTELLALARQRPGALNLGYSGPGSGVHLAAELLRLMGGVDLLLVPYSGTGPIATALAAGQVDMAFGGITQFQALVESGRVRLLGTTSREPTANGLPTIASQGLPDYEYLLWWGVVGPAGLPAAVVQTLNEALRRTIAVPEVAQRFAVLDGVLRVSSPGEFGAFLDAELRKWEEVIRTAGIQAQ